MVLLLFAPCAPRLLWGSKLWVNETISWQLWLDYEQLLNRRPPFGLEVLACANELPQYRLNITELGTRSSAGKGPIEVDISIDCSLLEPSQLIKGKRQKHRVIDMTAVLTLTSTSDFIDFRRIPWLFLFAFQPLIDKSTSGRRYWRGGKHSKSPQSWRNLASRSS